MTTRHVLLIVSLVGGLTWAVLRIPSMRTTDNNSTTPQMALTASNLNFGEVWEQERFSWTVQIANPSDQLAEIDRFARSCACIRIEPESVVIPPRGRADIRLTIDLRDKPNEPPSGARKSFTSMIGPIIRGVGQERWTLHGVVQKAIVAEPTSIECGESIIQGEPFESPRLRVKPQ